ncbi:Tyrosine-protein phosphatase non-receptor type 23 [Nymphon striatum]|nr:Tyrosine-protein phosphatase non-receptor type 23 [Nymphon striatum]
MEAVPRLPMLFFELKYSPENCEFDQPLRLSACKVAKDFTGCSTLKRYYSQLQLLQSKFPMIQDAEAGFNFVWFDIFSGLVYSVNDIKHEQAYILYNIGALHSELGAVDNRHSSEGMKVSCTHFQCAAWAFQHFRDECPQPRGSDTSHDLISYYINVMLAQAQECILEKSIQDNRKSTIISKVSIQISEYYKAAQKLLDMTKSDDEYTTISDIVGSKQFKIWKKFINTKIVYYKSLSYLYQGNQVEEQQKMGERVTYYQGALDTLNEATKASKGLEENELKEAISFTMDVISAKLNASKRENDFVYHEKVPALETLPELKGASLVKGIPFDPSDPEVSGVDIFRRLVPIEAHEAASLYSEEKAKLVRNITQRLQEKDDDLAVFMSSMQLEHLAIIDEVTHNTMPQELVERCAALSVRPSAVPDLVSAMQALSNICTDVDSDLKDIAEIAEEEENKEKDYQDIIGKRAPPILSVELKNEMKKYVEAHERASESNATLHKALSIHIQNLKQLSSSLDDLQASLPALESESYDQSSVVEMNRLFAKVEQMKQQRRQLETQFRNGIQSDDITKRVMAVGKDADMQALFEQELKKFDNVTALLEHNMTAQENILSAITEANAKFAETRKLVVEIAARRESKIQSLLASYDAYEDLLQKTQKGTEFYRKLQTNVSKLLTRMKSVYNVQEEERLQVIGNTHNKDLHQPTPSMSNAPKLKDFLPYMTERGPTRSVDPNLQRSVMGMRPNPVGAELNTGPLPTCSQQNIPNNMKKTPSDMYRQHYAPVSVNNFSRPPSNNYPSSPSLSGGSSAPTYPAQPPINFSSTNSPNYANNMAKYSNVAPNSRIQENSKVDPQTMYPEAPNNQQVPSMMHNLQKQHQLPQNYSNITKDISHKPVPIDQNYPAVSQYFVPGSQPSLLPNSNRPTSHASSYMQSNSYQQPLSSVSASIPPQQSSYAAASQSQPQQFPVSYQPAQSTGNQVSQTLFSQQSQSHIRPSYQQPQNASVNQLPQTVYSNQQPQPTASPQHMQAPIISQQPQVAAVPQNVQTTYPYSQKSTAPTYYPQQNVQHMGSQQTNYQYQSPQHYPQSFHQTPVPPTSQYSHMNNVPFQANQNFSHQQQHIPQSNQVTYQKPIVSENSSNNIPSNTGPTTAANVMNKQPVQPFSATQLSQNVVPGNYSQQGFQQYHPNPTPTNYQNAMPINQNYPGNVPTNIPQQFPIQNQQPSSNFQSTNNNDTKQGIAHNYANTFHEQNALLMQPLQPQVCPVSSSAIESKNLANTSVVPNNVQSVPSRSNQSTPNPSPGPSPSRQPPSSPPIVIPNDSKSVQHLEPPQTQYNKINSQDLLSSTPENRKNDTSEVLEPKVLTAEELRMQKEESERQSVQKDPYLDSEFLNKFTNEVKRYEKFVEGLMNPTLMGQTPLEQRWEEFISTQDKESRKLLISVARCYPIKNRNQDLMPYDQNRVEIKSLKDDYINASYISGISESCPKYIVTQSPLPVTYTDFWSMVWEQQTDMVVCLLSDSELKGHVYWPTERGKVSGHGPLKLSLQCSKDKTYCIEKMITLTHHEVPQPTPFLITVLRHIDKAPTIVIYTGSYKLGYVCVSFADSLLTTVSQAQGHRHIDKAPHRVLSAQLNQGEDKDKALGTVPLGGSGRSGILCLLSAAVKDINCGRGMIDVLSTVIRMCTQRKYIIYDKEQLRFCYEAVLYHARDLLLKRGILTNQSSFESKQATSTPNRHVRHPSEDFILGSGSLSTIQSKLGMDIPVVAPKSNNMQVSGIDSVACDDINNPDQKGVCLNANLVSKVSDVNANAKPPEEDIKRNELSSLLDPKTFSLENSGTQTKRKIGKEDFSSPQKGSFQKQNVDPNDPLSMLDPLWSVKK